MAFSRTWNAGYEANPSNAQVASQGAERIRELKVDLRERLEVDHSMAGDSDDGYHLYCTLLEAASDPSSKTDAGKLYTKDVSGVTELFYIDSDSNVTQLTDGGVFSLLGEDNTWAGKNTFSKSAVSSVDTLSDAANISVNADNANSFKVTLGGNRTLDVPSNGTAGQFISMSIIQDATGGRTLTFASGYKKASGISLTVTGTANAVDLFGIYYDGTSWSVISHALDIQQAV